MGRFIRNALSSVLNWFDTIREKVSYNKVFYLRRQLGHCDDSAVILPPRSLRAPQKVFMYEHSSLSDGAIFVMNTRTSEGKFIMKKWAGAAQNLTVITDNHSSHPVIGHFYQQDSLTHEYDKEEDVIIEEDAWVGVNVTLLQGVTIGRGSIIGAGAVVRKSVPPYAIAMGNPARIVGFKFTPEEIIEHERSLYKEDERISAEVLEKNYEKFFLKRIKDIKDFLK